MHLIRSTLQLLERGLLRLRFSGMTQITFKAAGIMTLLTTLASATVVVLPYGVASASSPSVWTIQDTLLLSGGGPLNSLFGVSCVSSTSCQAVGSYNTSGGLLVGIALSFNGTNWSRETLPSGSGGLNGVSCVSSTSCQAVGAGEGGAVALSFNGTNWSRETLPSGSGQLYGVSCVSSMSCQAVGAKPTGYNSTSAVALSFNGTNWSQDTIPSGSGVLVGVSCVSSTSCQAVGYNYSDSVGIAFSFNGTNWSQDTIPSGIDQLYGVSCVLSTSCQAVGGNANGYGTALTFNGINWSKETLPSGVGPLAGVSCVLSTSCQAVAGAALSFNGTNWAQDTIPSGIDQLYGVSCVSSTSCEAVGYNSNGTIILTTTATTITSITPDSSSLAGGGTATIIGSNFVSGASSVNFGSVAASNVKVVSPTEITATIPAATTPGLVDVTVTASGKTSVGSGFMYVTSGIPYTPVTPYRIADTRCSAGSQPSFCSSENLPSANQALRFLSAGGSITVQVTGTGSGSNSVPSSAQSVVVTVTAIAGTTAKNGYLTVYPAGTNPPTASSLNYAPGMAIPNLVTATLGSGGAIDILSSSANVNIVVDVEGYYEPSTSSTSNKFTPLPLPIRVLDTRCEGVLAGSSYCIGLTLPSANQLKAPGAGSYIKVEVAGLGNIPLSATAVSLVVTAAGPSSGGYLTVFPAGSSTTPPETSNVNFHKGIASADSVAVAVGTGGYIYIYNSAGTATNVIVDVNGYFSSSGYVLTPSSPVRICDTRSLSPGDVSSGVSGQCANSGTPLTSSGGPITVQVTGIAGIPSTAKAVVANITVVNTTGSGYLTAWAAGATQPTTSNINWGKGQVMPNMVISTLNSSGQMDIYCSSQANIIVDVVGWYS